MGTGVAVVAAFAYVDPRKGGYGLRYSTPGEPPMKHVHPLKATTLLEAWTEAASIIERGRMGGEGTVAVHMTPAQVREVHALLSGAPASSALGGLRRHLRNVMKAAGPLTARTPR